MSLEISHNVQLIPFSSQVNAVKFNDYASVVVSAGYDRSMRAWDCRSHSTEPIQVTWQLMLLSFLTILLDVNEPT